MSMAIRDHNEEYISDVFYDIAMPDFVFEDFGGYHESRGMRERAGLAAARLLRRGNQSRFDSNDAPRISRQSERSRLIIKDGVRLRDAFLRRVSARDHTR